MLKPGDNPRRALPNHEERGPVPYNYTLQQVAEAAGVNYQTVRKAVSDGRLDPENLRSVAGYIQGALTRKSKPLSEEALGLLPPRLRRWWKNRWPEFELHLCAHPGCQELLFFAGTCAEHGGDRKPPIRFDSDGHIVVLLGAKGEYIPLHRLITQAEPGSGLQTHHRDGNSWNNRWSNLESLTPEEHQDRHVGGILSADVVKKQPKRKPFAWEKSKP